MPRTPCRYYTVSLTDAQSVAGIPLASLITRRSKQVTCLIFPFIFSEYFGLFLSQVTPPPPHTPLSCPFQNPTFDYQASRRDSSSLYCPCCFCVYFCWVGSLFFPPGLSYRWLLVGCALFLLKLLNVYSIYNLLLFVFHLRIKKKSSFINCSSIVCVLNGRHMCAHIQNKYIIPAFPKTKNSLYHLTYSDSFSAHFEQERKERL